MCISVYTPVFVAWTSIVLNDVTTTVLVEADGAGIVKELAADDGVALIV